MMPEHTQGLVGPFFNLFVLVGLLVYYLRAPLRNFISERHVSVRDEISRVRTMLRDAQAKYDDFTSKLKAFDAEARAIRAQAQQDAQASKQRILTEAQRLSGMIVADARASARGLYEDLRSQLLGELGAKITDRAETLLKERLTGEDRARLKAEFSHQVEGVQ